MTVRSGNFTLSWPHIYTANGGGQVMDTMNYLLDLAPDLKIWNVQQIDDVAFRPKPPLFPVSGFEDCRLFESSGCWWASAAVRDRNPEGKSRVVLLQLDGAKVAAEHALSSESERHEKNWMPVINPEGMNRHFVYSCSPTVIVGYNEATGGVTREQIESAPPIARRFSGGTQVIPFDGGHLCIVHESVDLDDESRAYTHRWVWFNAEWRLTKLSRPFVFQKRGVEFAAGLVQRGDELIISYGRWDRDAFLAVVPVAEVRPLLVPPIRPEEIRRELRGAESKRITLFPEDRPTIVSTTLTGNSRNIIRDAMRSVVEWVDWCLVIDTGITDDTLEIAREVVGNKLVVRVFPWRDDFAAARNFALEAAAELGADWAVTLDTDERLELGDIDLRAALAAAGADTFHIIKKDGTYGKERLFRLPARGRFVGPTHEAFERETGVETLDGINFDELTKTEEQYRQKAKRDVAILTKYTVEHPLDARWFYYLGDSLAGLGRHEEAIAAFRTCADLDGWDEEAAWALYRAAGCLLELDRPVDAVEACAAGMVKHAGLAELPWKAAYASWKADRMAQAVYWAQLAAALGCFAGAGTTVPRLSFRYLPALWEGPYDVLRFALRQLGDEAGADEAERHYHEARTAREATGGQ